MFNFVNDAVIFVFFIVVFLILNAFLLSSIMTYVFFVILGFFSWALIFAFEKKFYLSCFVILISIIELIFIMCLTNIQNARDFFRKKFFKRKSSVIYDRNDLEKKIYEALEYLAKENCGALILIQNKDDLVEKFLNKENSRGVIIKSAVSAEMLKCIFYGHNVLHDGAVIIVNNLIYAANVFIPTTLSEKKSKFGARHAAAFNVSNKTDATVIVLSEEKKEMSIFEKGAAKKIQKIFI